jgi:exosome complex component RRP42
MANGRSVSPQILLLSQPLSYPLPLLSLTTHLALLSTRMPALISEKDEDPLFNDDWEASTYLYTQAKKGGREDKKPPVTMLVMSVGENVIFDPSKEELAVADGVMAISVAAGGSEEALKMIAARTVDPPSRLTGAGVPTALNTTAGATSLTASDAVALREQDQGQTVWRPPRGGIKRAVVTKMIKMVVQKDGVGQEVLEALAAVDS